MPANKYALIRYRVIDECLTNRFRRFPTKEDLRRACEDALYGSQNERISLSTIEKDLYAMRFDTVLGYEAPIVFDKANKGYCYSEEGFTIKKVPLGEEDLEVLRFATQMLYQFKDIPVFRSFENVLGKLKEHVSLSEGELDQGYLDHMLFEENVSGEGDRHLTTILKAISEQRRVNISYSFFSDEKEDKDYTLEPYLLKQFRSRWYLLANDTSVAKVKTFGLERITELVLSDDHYARPEFDAKAYFSDTYGISHLNEESQEIILEMDRPQSMYLLSRPFHHSLERIGTEEGYDVMKMKLVVNQDLVNELMSWSPHIRVIEPIMLRDVLLQRADSLKVKNISTFKETT